MTDVARAGVPMMECEMFTAFWTCLRCDSTQGRYYEDPERPEECSQCGYHQFKPKYHLFVSR